jgi:hypothetical protein
MLKNLTVGLGTKVERATMVMAYDVPLRFASNRWKQRT